MKFDREGALLWNHVKTLLGWPAWWARLLLCVALTAVVLWALSVVPSTKAEVLVSLSAIGAIVTVLVVLMAGPPAARPGADAFALSRPLGRAGEVNRTAFVSLGLGLVACLALGVAMSAAAPMLFRTQFVKLSMMSWFPAELNWLSGVDVVDDSLAKRVCLEKWAALRWGGTSKCNKMAKRAFTGFSGPSMKTFVFASESERACLVKWSESSEPWCFSYLFRDQTSGGSENVTVIVRPVTSVSLASAGRCHDRVLADLADPTCGPFAAELLSMSGSVGIHAAYESEAQPCFEHWERALGSEPTCWKPPESVDASIPPLGWLIVACLGVALFAGAMLRTALLRVGRGRAALVPVAAIALAWILPYFPDSLAWDARAVLWLTSACGVVAYVLALWRWKRGDFR